MGCAVASPALSSPSTWEVPTASQRPGFQWGAWDRQCLALRNDVGSLQSSLKMTPASSCWASTEIAPLHYPVCFTCRSQHASHALLQTHTVLGRAEIASAQLTEWEVESRNALNIGSVSVRCMQEAGPKSICLKPQSKWRAQITDSVPSL